MRLQTQKLIKNVSLASVGSFLAAIFAISTNILIARTVATDQFGLFMVALSISLIGGTLSTFGFADYLVREWTKSGKTTLSADTTVFLFGSIFFVFMLTALLIFITCNGQYALILLATSVPITAWLRVKMSQLRVRGQYGPIVLILLAPALIRLAPAIFVHFSTNTLNDYCFMVGGLFVVATLFIVKSIFRTIKKTLGKNIKKELVLTLKGVSPFIASQIIVSLRDRLDIILLSVLGTPTLAAIFTPASLVLKRSSLFATTVADTALLPTLFKHCDNEKSYKRKSWKLVLSLGIVGTGLALVVIFFADQILGLFGKEYLEARPVLITMAAMIPLRYMCIGLTNALKHQNMVAGKARDQLITLIISAVTLCIFIPLFGTWGAVLSVGVSMVTLFTLYAIRLLNTSLQLRE